MEPTMRTATQPPRDERGMTAVELVVTLVIIFIVGGMALWAIGLGGALSAGRLKGGSEELANALRYTRQLAITEARDHCISMAVISGVAQYQVFLGGRSVTSCTGSSVANPVNLSQNVTVPTLAFVFTPVSVVDPVGPTSIDVTVTNPNTGQTCTVTLTVTGEGGVREPPAVCTGS
jgi:Tfp pilus assembly protein FimT